MKLRKIVFAGAIVRSVVVEDSVLFLVNPQLLERAWTASASRLAELIRDYELIADLGTVYERIEELRWRVRYRTEHERTILDKAIRALVVELRPEVEDVLTRVEQEIAGPHVHPTGLVRVRSVGAAVKTSAANEVEVIQADSAQAPDDGPVSR
jgi:hypothetical protein